MADEQDAPRRAMKPPRRARFGRFVHILARFYQNYIRAIMRAAKRKRGRAVDVDTQESAEGTPWALHWPTVGKNKLRDPKKRIKRKTRIDSLTDEQIERLRGPNGQRPVRLITALVFAASENVRVEVEVKVTLSEAKVRAILERSDIKKMNDRGDLQFKTLAFMGYKHNPNAAAARLRPIHDAGGTTIMSFTGFGRRRGIPKKAAWPVTDYYRGRAKWVA